MNDANRNEKDNFDYEDCQMMMKIVAMEDRVNKVRIQSRTKNPEN